MPLTSDENVLAANTAPVFEALYADPPGFGFFDTTPVEPLAGNSATTLGGQRRAVVQAALDIWATWLDSPVPVRVSLRFQDLGCNIGGAGAAWPSALFNDFPNAPLPATRYPAALATALAGQRFDGLNREIDVAINSRLEEDDCFTYLPDGFWYGLDNYEAPAPAGFGFLELILHEIGHGLGFSTTLDPQTGNYLGTPALPDIYTRHLYSISQQRLLTTMAPADRAASIALGNDLVLNAEALTARIPEVLNRPPKVRFETAQGEPMTLSAAIHGFAPQLPPPGLIGPLFLADNPSDQPATAAGERVASDACQPLHADALAPRTVLLATGAGCTYAEKWQHAHAAGASALLVIDTRSDDEPAALSRIGMALPVRQPIPIWSVDSISGQVLLDQVHMIDEIELGFDANQAHAGTAEGQLQVHGSIAHLASDTSPRLLMGTRFFSGGVFGFTDLSTDVLYDLGWPGIDARQAQFAGSWFNPERSGEGCQLTLEGDEETWILTCYFNYQGAQSWVIGTSVRDGSVLNFDPVTITSGARHGSEFDPDEVVRETWGRIRVSLIDCNTAVFDFWPELDNYVGLQSRMRKVVPGSCQRNNNDQPDRTLAGSYFAPDRSGEGIHLSVEANESTAILAFYGYDQGAQIWAFGNGEMSEDQVDFGGTVITRGTGYGPDFDPDAVERVVFGDISVRWLNCNDIELTIDPVLDGFEAVVQPMTRIVQRSCE